MKQHLQSHFFPFKLSKIYLKPLQNIIIDTAACKYILAELGRVELTRENL